MLYAALPRCATGIEVMVQLPAKAKKCFGEQVAKQELLVVEFRTQDEKKVSVTVMGPHATIFSDHDREKVKTAFTTSEAGPHWMCVQNEADSSTEVTMIVLLGPQAKDYTNIAKKEHLEDTQVSLRKIAE